MAYGFDNSRGWEHRDTVLLSCTVAMFSTMLARVSFSPLIPAITDTFGISNGLIGLALTGMWFTYGAVQFPSGLLASIYGSRSVLLFAAGGTAIMSVVIASAPVFVVFFLGTILLGTVAGTHYSVATSLLSQRYENIGTAIGIHHLGGAAGGLIGPILATWVLLRYGWRWAIIAGALIALLTFVLIYQSVNPNDSTGQSQKLEEQFSVEFIIDTLRQPLVAPLVGVAIALVFISQSLITFLPVFLVDYHNLSSKVAGNIFSIFFFTFAVMQTGLGPVADRMKKSILTLSCLIITVTGLVTLVVLVQLPLIIIGSILVGGGTAGMTVVIAQIMGLFQNDEHGSKFGLTQSVIMSVSSFGSAVIGFLTDAFGWSISFYALAGLGCTTIIGYIFVLNKY